MKYRTIITINPTGEKLYGAFQDITPAELEQVKEIYENISKVTYLCLTSPEGDLTYIKGDAIAYVTIEKTRA